MGLFDKFKENKMQEAMQQAAAYQQQAGQFASAAAMTSGMSPGALGAEMDEVAEVNARAQEQRRVMASGLKGTGTIVSSQDTGRRLVGNALVALKVAVTPENGTPYTVDFEMVAAGTDMGPYAPGTQYNLRIDPANPQNVTFSQ